MNLAANFEIQTGSRTFRIRPLTVRERIALGNALVERERRKAIDLAKAIGVPPAETLEAVRKAVTEAERLSSLVLSCFTMEGAVAVMRIACETVDEADAIASSMEPGELGVLAARCLNVPIEIDRKDTEDAPGK